MKKAVIFDMDGVIIQSEIFYLKRRELFFNEQGIIISDDFQQNTIGSNPKAMFEALFPNDLAKQQEMLIAFANFRKDFKVNYSEMLTDHIQEVLTWLKLNDYKIGLASAGEYLSLVNVLEVTGLTGFFDVVVSGADMAKSKPAPDVYLAAAEKLGMKPSECVAIEDSTYGIQAAISAGMDCLALKPKDFVINQSQATEIMISLQEIPIWLTR
ncbi:MULTISPECIES: HAD family phosphatase [Vagococcus]|uniref:Hydrolase, haloacid dehalogenase-like family n=1 Tax=Vagococcus fluvialis bH819 TaxID=1255619 RepID=A0A1X6WMV6_9ENTE|nr:MULTISPECIES: HAD family phosphatase [Vagococcus]SLM85605.1 Hydrolase, haloacid dehalogenase-like family [Vagococcus fluvialis bH819]HCM89573.1 HAD family phosphatase [Vagococcus sp.]